MTRSLFLILAFMTPTAARAECNIANIIFGKVRIEMIPSTDPSNVYETGIIFGDDFDSKRFAYGRILGKIDAPERDGSRRISNVDQDECGRVDSRSLIIDSEGDCATCSKAQVNLQRVGKDAFAVMSDGKIMGTIEGHLPRIGR